MIIYIIGNLFNLEGSKLQFSYIQTLIWTKRNSSLDTYKLEQRERHIVNQREGTNRPLPSIVVGTDYPWLAFLLSLIRLRHLSLLLNSQARLLDADKPAAVTTDANATRRRHNPS